MYRAAQHAAAPVLPAPPPPLQPLLLPPPLLLLLLLVVAIDDGVMVEGQGPKGVQNRSWFCSWCRVWALRRSRVISGSSRSHVIFFTPFPQCEKAFSPSCVKSFPVLLLCLFSDSSRSENPMESRLQTT